MSIKATSHKYKILYILLSTTLSTLMLLSSCGPQEVELPFQTIEQFYYSPQYEDRRPGLVIIASADEVDQMNGWITPKALEQIRGIDYDTHFIVIAFLGWQSTGHEGIHIEQVIRQGDTVSVSALVGRPTGETIVTSPYHLIKVQKVGQWGANISFALVVEETTIASQSHYIP